MAKARRPIRIANCSGAAGDPGDLMLAQARAGPVDVITGDYLAEMNLAQYAEAFAAGKHPGYVPTALDGLRKTLPLISEKGIKVIINGGALNPRGLAVVVQELAQKANYSIKIAYVEGDNVLPRIQALLKPDAASRLPHLDGTNPSVRLAKDTATFLSDPGKPIVSANAYLGGRAIRRGLEAGADVIICGRVADASPVVAAAAWWHGWSDEDYDRLAGALCAGHLIECSFYVTGANFAGFARYPTGALLNLACPIAEVDAEGLCVVTKHEALNGFVTEDTVKCQLLYELQGNIYLNSDVKADLAGVRVEEIGKNRVRVSGVKGFPPPPTTKLAIFYKGGFQGEFTIFATGLDTAKKWDLQEAQMRSKLDEWGFTEKIDVLEFQRMGASPENPKSQLESTSSLRIFVQAATTDLIKKVFGAWAYNFMQHFAGMQCTFDFRQMLQPLPFLGYFPALIPQSSLQEAVVFLHPNGTDAERRPVWPLPRTEAVAPRANYDPVSLAPISSFGPTRSVPLGTMALTRSGDKGANVNVGIFVRTDKEWAWLRAYLTRDRLRELVGPLDWRDDFFVERVEFPNIRAVHFVVYGALGRGVSSSARVDSLGKGFGEYLRARHVPVPVALLEGRKEESKL